MRTRFRIKELLFVLFAIPFLIVSAGVQTLNAQADRLTLAEVLTGLQSRSSGASLSDKNVFITRTVKQRGVTFRLSTEISNELRRAGASTALMTAIRTNGPTAERTTNNPGNASNVAFDRLWVTYNVTENGLKGMRIHSKFTVSQMKNVPLYLTYRFQREDGDVMTSDNTAYRNKTGQLAVFRKLTPAYDPAVYKDLSIFVPYREIVLPAGKYSLKVDADIIYENGDFLKHFKLHPFTFTKPAKTTAEKKNLPGAKFTRMWIDHNFTQGGRLGMKVHADITVNNLLGKASNLAVVVQKRDGSAIYAKTSAYKSTNGQLTAYRAFTPKYGAAHFKDITVFIPYDEFSGVGQKREYRLHADILYPNSGNIHVTYYNFVLPSGTRTAATTAPRAKFTRMWIEHNQRQGGILGMKVHTNVTVYNLMNQDVKLAVAVERRNGTKVLGKRTAYRSTNGQLTGYRALNPAYQAAVFKDLVVFIPYREFNVPRGTSSFRIHADIIYPNKGNLHITYYNFTKRIP